MSGKRAHTGDDKRLDILYVLASLGTGGQERYVVDNAISMVSRGHEVSVATPHIRDNGAHLVESLQAKGIEVVVLADRRCWRNRWLARSYQGLVRLRRLRSLIRHHDYDVVHGVSLTSNYYAALACLGQRTKVVWGVTETLPLTDIMLRITERVLAPLSDVAVAVSDAAKDTLVARSYPSQKIVAVQPGVDTDRFCIDPNARAEIRSSLGIGEKDLLVGAVGRIVPVKDFPTYLRACALVTERIPNSWFLVIGPGDKTGLQSLAKELGIFDRVHWVGVRTDLERWYNAMDVFVMASISEGSVSYTSIEASVTGTPTVFTDVGVASQIALHKRSVVPVGDAAAMANAIVESFLGRTKPSRDHIRERFASRFSLDGAAESLETAYYSVVSS